MTATKPGNVLLNGLRGDRLADLADQVLSAEELETAVALFDSAEPDVADPDRCAGGRWMAHMLRGDFASAWSESDAIRRRGRPDPHRFWQGEDIRGQRLILRSLHGFGDAVQIFRFLPRLRQMAAKLIVEVPPRLVPLASCFDGMGEVITWGQDAPPQPPEWNVQMEVMEVPYMLRVTADDLTPTQGYLHLPASERTRVAGALGEALQPRVGLVWCAGEWNPSRSIPFADLDPLLSTEGVEFWSLQGEPERAAWLAQGGHGACRDGQVCGDGILALAATIADMDLVITVDTLAAHLAGALGVPCWMLLQHRADWRWMSARTDTPWYPRLRLFRQQVPGDWRGLVGSVGRELADWAARPRTKKEQ